jgi:hypothetical protein
MEKEIKIYKKREKEFEKKLLNQIINQKKLNREKLIEKQGLIKHLYSQNHENDSRPILYGFSFDPMNIIENKTKLVPIRLDIEMDGVKIRDVFTWNLEDKSISIDDFAKLLLRDTGNSVNHYQYVSKAIKDQIDDYFQHSPELFYKNLELPERRILIKLDITIEQQSVIDKVNSV